MKLTNEADYALRIIFCLANSGQKCEASAISQRTVVPLRFTLKILRKFVHSGIVKSYRGATGGYTLNKSLEAISVLEVVETVSGPIRITNCLSDDAGCNRIIKKTDCQFHNFFVQLNNQILNSMREFTFDKIIQEYSKGVKNG